MIGDVDLTLPEFLRISAEDRKKAWLDHPPRHNQREGTMTDDNEKKDEKELMAPKSNVPSSGRTTPGLDRLKASPKAEEIRQTVLADQKEALNEREEERTMTDTHTGDNSKTERKAPPAKKAAKKVATKKAAPAKKATAKKVAVKTPRKGAIDPAKKIVIVSKENPRREGSEKHRQFELARKSKTVGDYQKAKGHMGSLKKCVSKGWIKLS
jgi:hypothetical protein